MRPEDVLAMVHTIRVEHGPHGPDETWDNESAHEAADAVWQAVLRSIAAGAADADLLAGAALITEEMDFERWYR